MIASYLGAGHPSRPSTSVRFLAQLPHRLRAPIAGRAAWGIADQGLSSLSNFALSILIARSASASAFGGFTVSLTAYAIILQVVRGLAGLPLSVRYSTVSNTEWRLRASWAAGAALAIAAILGLVATATGLVLGGELGIPMIVLGVSLTGLMVQDTWRFSFFAARRGESAFVNDGVWTFAFLAVVAAGLAFFSIGATAMMIVWGVTATLAAIYGCVQVGTVPRPLRSRVWFADTKDIGLRFAIETLIVTSGSQGAFFFIGIFSGLASLGAVRGAYTLQGALNILFFGITIMGIPEAARTATVPPRAAAGTRRSCFSRPGRGGVRLGAHLGTAPGQHRDRVSRRTLAEFPPVHPADDGLDDRNRAAGRSTDRPARPWRRQDQPEGGTDLLPVRVRHRRGGVFALGADGRSLGARRRPHDRRGDHLAGTSNRVQKLLRRRSSLGDDPADLMATTPSIPKAKRQPPFRR